MKSPPSANRDRRAILTALIDSFFEEKFAPFSL
jgi:hypothetical protein